MALLGATLLSATVLSATVIAAPQKPHKPHAPPPIKTVAVAIACPDVLGQGVKSLRRFCEVTAGRDPAKGDIIELPKHQGTAVVRFHIHNRQLVSTSLVKAGRAYTRATATVGALAPDGALLGRGTVQTEFRRESDLFDRVSGGAGASGLKAVAPVGDELIQIEVPESVDVLSLLGEKLLVVQVDGQQTVTADGRPVALVSNADVDYRPMPPKPAPKRKTTTKKKHK